MNVSNNKIIALQCKNCFSNNVDIDWDKNMFHCNSCGTYFKIDAESIAMQKNEKTVDRGGTIEA